jgi:hypothetical protein
VRYTRNAIAIYVLMMFYLASAFVIANWWFVIAIVLLPFVYMLIANRMRGEVGISYDPSGNVGNLLMYATGYTHPDAWLVPKPTGLTGGPLTQLKVAQLTETSASSLIKGYWLLLPASIAVGLLFLELFWRIAPVPSARYPGAAIYWPILATFQSLWITGTQSGLLQPLWIMYSFAGGAIAYLLLEFVPLIPVSFTGIAVGFGQAVPFSIAWLIGGIISKICEERLGVWWNENKRIIAAGMMIGESIAVVLSVAITLVLTSEWVMPF